MTAKTKFLMCLGAITFVLLVLVFPSLNNSSQASESQLDQFPQHTHKRVELPPQSGEEIRYVYYASDGLTKTMVQIEHRSGVTTFITNNKDGKPKELRSYFPAKEGENKRQLQSLVLYEDNGTSYLSHQVFRADGSLERNGGRLPDGAYQTVYFKGDGGSVIKRVITKDGQLIFFESFGEKGQVLEKSEWVSATELRTTKYGANGRLISVISDFKDGTREGKTYYADGVTLKNDFKVRTYSISVDYHDSSGKLTLNVEYNLQGMATTVYKDGEKALFRQYWRHVGGRTLADAQFRLVRVEEYHRWKSGRDQHEVKRVFSIASDGKTPAGMMTPNTDNPYSSERNLIEFYPDGSVKTETDYDTNNKVTSTKTFSQGARKIKFAPNQFTQPSFEPLDVPDSKVKAEAEQGEGDEHEGD